MIDLSPKKFFSYDGYKEKAIFENTDFVWDVIKEIPKYLSQKKLGQIKSFIPEGVILKNPELIYIGENCEIEPGCYIQGPCIIDDFSSIRYGAYIRGNVIIGKNCVVGHATEIKNSLFLDNAKAPHFNYVGDSILGNHTNIGAGVVCSNYRLDQQEIIIKCSEALYFTKLKKLGLILGDNSQIGCNTVLNPGTIIGKDSFCYPCLNIGGYIPDKSKVTKN
ncbi:MAG: UDP-N-acetylglucosamine diphosphorylase [Chlamydiae bacterium]|nr:UDP-N-acetylglucosamine diphosphorylase [Chlamydiota bacterium]